MKYYLINIMFYHNKMVKTLNASICNIHISISSILKKGLDFWPFAKKNNDLIN